jgi:hypothetical protein
MKDPLGREVEFGSQVAIEQYLDMADEFIKNVFNIELCFVSDDTSLYDFEDSKEKIFKKVKYIYNVDISDIEDLNLVEVLKRIRILKNI